LTPTRFLVYYTYGLTSHPDASLVRTHICAKVRRVGREDFAAVSVYVRDGGLLRVSGELRESQAFGMASPTWRHHRGWWHRVAEHPCSLIMPFSVNTAVSSLRTLGLNFHRWVLDNV